jgi:hypothetical protein
MGSTESRSYNLKAKPYLVWKEKSIGGVPVTGFRHLSGKSGEVYGVIVDLSQIWR